jgi:hypothetical protein
MGIPNLFEHFGWWSIVVPVLGLITSAVVRKRTWGVIVWLPTTLLCLYQTAWLGLKLLAYGGVSGPDAIGVGLAYMVLIPSVLAGLAALVVCFFIRPRRKTWHLATAVVAVMLCLSLTLLMNRQDGLTITIQLLDEDSKPLPEITALSKAIEQGMTAGRGSNVSDAEGRIYLRLRKGQQGEIEFRAKFPDSNSLSKMPAWKTLRIEPDPSANRLVLDQRGPLRDYQHYIRSRGVHDSLAQARQPWRPRFGRTCARLVGCGFTGRDGLPKHGVNRLHSVTHRFVSRLGIGKLAVGGPAPSGRNFDRPRIRLQTDPRNRPQHSKPQP